MENKQCTTCHAEIPKKARRCKHCTAKQPRPFYKNPWFYVIAFILFPFVVNSILPDIPTDLIESAETITDESFPAEKLELQSWNSKTEYGWITVQGEVKNISGKVMDNVEAVASFYDESGTFISSNSALIDYQTLMPGQISPFSVMENANPLMSNVRVSFKEFWGSEIPYKEKE